MEFLLVLPLYFALVGGLFFVGELMINRIRLQIGDFTVAWMGADNFTGESITSEMKYLLSEAFDTDGSFEVRQVNEESKVNHFSALFMGGVKLTIEMPIWIRGMTAMQNMTMGEKDKMLNEDNQAVDFDWVNTKDHHFFDGYATHMRSRLFHRIAYSGTEFDRSREINAQEMVAAGYLANVISDSWINNAEDGIPVGSIENVDQGEIKRVLWTFGQ